MKFIIDNQELTIPINYQDTSSFTVSSVPRSYQVTWDSTDNPCHTINDVLSINPNNLLFIDENVFELYGKDIKHPENKIFKAPATESFKTLEGVTQLCDFLFQNDFTKGETLVVVGGGIIQDIGAFVGASYKRGINWVHFPTTLLAMSDSCIGGKSGINYNGIKNQLALFSAPRNVIINPAFLDTLEKRDLQSGLGEILKLHIIGGPAMLAEYGKHVSTGKLVSNESIKSLVLGALFVKKAVIEEDEFELNIRKALNYGHTLGHAIESISDYAIPHGIAVVAGMMLVNSIGCNQDLLTPSECREINHACLQLLDNEMLNHLKHIDLQTMLQHLKQDKKVMGDSISLVIARSSGHLNGVKMQLNEQLMNQINDTFNQLFVN